MKLNKNLLIVGGLIIVVLLIFIKTGGSSDNSGQNNQINPGQVQLVDSIQFSKLSKDEKNFLLDVHIPEQTHIPGTDAFIPYNEIAQNIDKLPQDKSTPILVYCRSGSMSKTASEEIAKLGYINVYDLEGGIISYRESNTEVIITPSNQDLGEVIYGDVPTTTFTLTNFTPLPLTITRISTSCGCTSAEVVDKEIGAYESTTVNVNFDPAVHGDATDVGDITRTIYISTDNSNFPQLTSTITAYVVKEK
jgi:rhodanese-related sulfurtransferase